MAGTGQIHSDITLRLGIHYKFRLRKLHLGLPVDSREACNTQSRACCTTKFWETHEKNTFQSHILDQVEFDPLFDLRIFSMRT